jgi:aromatic amino acid aminotransferase I
MSAEVFPCDALAKKPPTLTGDVSKDTIKEQSFVSWLFGKKKTKTITIPKSHDVKDPSSVDLSTLLQYSSAEGHPALREFIRNFVAKVYQPGTSDWQIQLNVGATAGWSQVVNMLMERGDAILVEEFTYPGAMNAYQPLDIKPVS